MVDTLLKTLREPNIKKTFKLVIDHFSRYKMWARSATYVVSGNDLDRLQVSWNILYLDQGFPSQSTYASSHFKLNLLVSSTKPSSLAS